MIKLPTVVQHMSDKDFASVAEQFKKTRAEKFIMLLTFLKEGRLSEEEMIEKLQVNKIAFYTLKSRLAEKIQEYLYKNVGDERIELLRNLANIHNLIYSTPKATAVAMLRKMEAELRDNDMPNELTLVYSALKKLHLHTPKYYEYSQLYNKHIAFTIAIDKAEDLVSNFTRTLGEYEITRDKMVMQRLWLIKKELANVCRLYDSHHLGIYKKLVDISFALFVPLQEAIRDDDPVEDMLAAAFRVFDTYDKDVKYQYLRNVFNFLAFEYYHGLKLYKNEARYFEEVDRELPTFLLSDHCSFSTRFLISRIERHIHLGNEKDLGRHDLVHEVDASDVPNYINLNLYKAACAFYSGKYNDAVKVLNEVLNTVSFKNIFHAETEVKLFLALACSMLNKYEQAEVLLRSVSRKITDTIEDGCYENALTFIRMLKLQMSSEVKNVEEKLRSLRDKFFQQNNGHERMLTFLKLDDAFIRELAKGVKAS